MTHGREGGLEMDEEQASIAVMPLEVQGSSFEQGDGILGSPFDKPELGGGALLASVIEDAVEGEGDDFVVSVRQVERPLFINPLGRALSIDRVGRLGNAGNVGKVEGGGSGAREWMANVTPQRARAAAEGADCQAA